MYLYKPQKCGVRKKKKKNMLFSLLNADCHSQKNKTLLQQKVAVREK